MFTYLSNAFSLSMVPPSCNVAVRPLSLPRAAELLWEAQAQSRLISVIGHRETSDIVSGLIGHPLKSERYSVALRPCDEMLVAQYLGPRLPEGATSLPEGAKIEWRHVTFMEV